MQGILFIVREFLNAWCWEFFCNSFLKLKILLKQITLLLIDTMAFIYRANKLSVNRNSTLITFHINIHKSNTNYRNLQCAA